MGACRSDGGAGRQSRHLRPTHSAVLPLARMTCRHRCNCVPVCVLMTLCCNSYSIFTYALPLLSLHEHTGLNVAVNHSPEHGLATTHSGVHMLLTCCLCAQSIWRAVLCTMSGRVPPCAAQSQALRSVQTQNQAARAFLPAPPCSVCRISDESHPSQSMRTS